MRLAPHVILAALLVGCGSSTEPKPPVIAGAWTFDGSGLGIDCTVHNGPCPSDYVWWVGHVHGTLNFGSIVPTSLEGDLQTGQVDVALTANVTANETSRSGPTDVFPTPTTMNVVPGSSATIHFANGAIKDIVFDFQILTPDPHPERGRPFIMVFGLNPSSQGFDSNIRGYASSLRHP